MKFNMAATAGLRGTFLLSLVPIGPVVSEKKLEM
jgi:hypothetical protein